MNLLTPKLINSKTYKLANLQPHKLINSPTNQLTNLQTHKLTNLKSYNIFYKTGTVRHTILVKNQPAKQAICSKMQQIAFLFQSIFKNAACILHHLAFLVWLSARIFLCPICHFQPLKPHFLMVILPFLPCFSWLKKGLFIPLQWIYMLNRLAFSTKMHCVQHQNTLRLAPKCTAFSGILHCIQRHIALYLAAKRTTFSGKQPRNGCK